MQTGFLNYRGLSLLTFVVALAGSATGTATYSPCSSSSSTTTLAGISPNGCCRSDKTLISFTVTDDSSNSVHNDGLTQSTSTVQLGTSDTFTSSSVPWSVTGAFSGTDWSL